MKSVIIVLVVSFAVTQAAYLSVPTCNQSAVQQCNAKYGITGTYIQMLIDKSTRCYDAFELDVNFRCSISCILSQLGYVEGADNLQIFRNIFCNVNQSRIDFYYKHCLEMTLQDPINSQKCGRPYAIQRCISMHLGLYPAGSQTPSFCYVTPPIKDQCQAEARSINPNFCVIPDLPWIDISTATPEGMCYQVCLLRMQRYISGNEINFQLWWEQAYQYLDFNVFSNQVKICMNEAARIQEMLQIRWDDKNCGYLYYIFRCVQQYFNNIYSVATPITATLT